MDRIEDGFGKDLNGLYYAKNKINVLYSKRLAVNEIFSQEWYQISCADRPQIIKPPNLFGTYTSCSYQITISDTPTYEMTQYL